MKMLFVFLLLFIISFSKPVYLQTNNENVANQDSIKIAKKAFQFINTPVPHFDSSNSTDIDTSAIRKQFTQVYKSEPHYFLMRDGKHLYAQRFEKESKLTVIVLHGVLSNSLEMNRVSGMLRKALNAEVYALDLRGHGKSDGKPGDIDYVGQYEDDLVDVIRTVREEKPDGKIVLAGHSMGGGIELRFAMKKDHPKVDGYILFAPLLGQNTPTFKKQQDNSDTLGNKKEPFMKIDFPRIIGLKMFNSIGVQKYNYLPVLFFNLPKEAPLNKYSYRSDMSMAPDDYKAGLHAVDKPLLVLVGKNDEVFDASAFVPVIKNNSIGEIAIIKNETHNSIINSMEGMNIIKVWAEKNGFISKQ
jgi:pimeloyl-ACP methyl ester carboxylesterase